MSPPKCKLTHCTHTHTYIHTHVMHTYTHIRIRTHSHTHTHTHTRHAFTHTRIHTHMHTHTHTHTYTHTHTHAHTTYSHVSNVNKLVLEHLFASGISPLEYKHMFMSGRRGSVAPTQCLKLLEAFCEDVQFKIWCWHKTEMTQSVALAYCICVDKWRNETWRYMYFLVQLYNVLNVVGPSMECK